MSLPNRIRELLGELEARIDKVENNMLACQGVPAFLDPMQRDWAHQVSDDGESPAWLARLGRT